MQGAYQSYMYLTSAATMVKGGPVNLTGATEIELLSSGLSLIHWAYSTHPKDGNHKLYTQFKELNVFYK